MRPVNLNEVGDRMKPKIVASSVSPHLAVGDGASRRYPRAMTVLAQMEAQCRDCGEISAEWGCQCKREE